MGYNNCSKFDCEVTTVDENKIIPQEEEAEYEPTIVELDGEPFEVIDAIQYRGANYVAVVEYNENESDEEDATEFIVLQEVEDESGEFYLSTIDDDELYEQVGEAFTKHFDELFADVDGLIQ